MNYFKVYFQLMSSMQTCDSIICTGSNYWDDFQSIDMGRELQVKGNINKITKPAN